MRLIAQNVFVAVAALAFAGTELSAQNVRTPTKKNSNQILLEEVQAARATNVFDLIQALRPQWLRVNVRETLRTQSTEVTDSRFGTVSRQAMDEPEIIVYVNNTKTGTIESLRDLPVANVSSVELVSPATATMRWGSGHTHGAIVVHSTEERTP
jgi:hypothetical protein